MPPSDTTPPPTSGDTARLRLRRSVPLLAIAIGLNLLCIGIHQRGGPAGGLILLCFMLAAMVYGVGAVVRSGRALGLSETLRVILGALQIFPLVSLAALAYLAWRTYEALRAPAKPVARME